MSLYAIRKTETGYKFDVFTDDKVKLATSEVYKTTAAASTGLANYITSAEIANVSDPDEKGYKKVKFPRYEIFKDNEGKYRFRLRGKNGAILASSPAFAGKGEIGRYLPGYRPRKRRIIIIVMGPCGVPIIVVVEIPGIIDPRAEINAGSHLKAFIADQVKGAFAFSDRVGKYASPVVITPEVPANLNNIVVPGALKEFDINKVILPEKIKELLNEK